VNRYINNNNKVRLSKWFFPRSEDHPIIFDKC
jgi:hypothetical protein